MYLSRTIVELFDVE